MIIIKVCAVSIAAVIIIGIIRIYRPEFTVEAVLCGSILLLACVMESLRHSLTYLEELYSQLSAAKTYFPVILKALGIAYVTEFTSALCQDAGEKSIAGKVEFAGKIAIFFTALPVFQSLLDMLNEFL